MTDPYARLLNEGRILLVDDEEDCAFVARLVLRKAGFNGTLTACTSASAALDHLRTPGAMPDLLLVDINMPGTNGFDLLAQCELEGLLPRPGTSVVVCSSSNRPIDLERARAFRSVIGYVEKALTVEQLEGVMHAHLRTHTQDPHRP